MDPEIERYYRALSLEPEAPPEKIYEAYRDLVRVWDPQRFANQPHLELMAEAKLKEIIEAYNALAKKPEASPAAPPPASIPDLLVPVPDHIADRNDPKPLFNPLPDVAPEFGRPPEEPPAEPLPPRPWEEHRPATYPKPAPEEPSVEVAPPPGPSLREKAAEFAAHYWIFLIPLVLAGAGLFFYVSMTRRGLHEAELYAKAKQAVAEQAQRQAASTPAATPTPPVAKRVLKPVAAKAEAAIELANGTEMIQPRGPRGSGRFRIANRSGQDAVIRVAPQGAPGSPLRQVYVQDGTEVPIAGFGTGVYVVYISLGPVTKAPRRFGAPLGPFQFMQVESVDGPQSDDYQIVLKPVE